MSQLQRTEHYATVCLFVRLLATFVTSAITGVTVIVPLDHHTETRLRITTERLNEVGGLPRPGQLRRPFRLEDRGAVAIVARHALDLVSQLEALQLDHGLGPRGFRLLQVGKVDLRDADSPATNLNVNETI